ncbi:alpha-L-rhamnosidase [Clostridia bacterium]|nr:alpha-L-rhamnosidase [Clostridia bacterium]
MNLTRLMTNYQTENLGLTDRLPVFSWQMESDVIGTMQTAYRVVARSDNDLMWDSNLVESDQSNDVVYAGKPLKSRSRYGFTVTARDNHGNDAATSSWFELGLDPDDWTAEWIESNLPAAMPEQEINISQAMMGIYKKTPPDERLRPCTYLRREFNVDQVVNSARLYVAVHGIYHCEINGKMVSDAVFAQEFTPYPKDTRYQIYDVTALVRQGANAIGFSIADGWWCGRFGMTGKSCEYGDKHGLLMQLELSLSNGDRQVITSDLQFTAGYGPIRYSDIFIGEKYDANMEITGWSSPGFDDSAWQGVQTAAYGYKMLKPQAGGFVRVVRRFPAKDIITTPKGETVVDLGENIAGFLRMTVNAPKGTVIKLEHSEVLSDKGNFLKNIMGRNKDQTDYYICRGKDDVFEPRFTFHGFRYVRVSGLADKTAASFEGVVISSVDEGHSSFHTSDERLNKLQSNILRSQTANMVSIPTDCPQRERAGWTGDIQVFYQTAAFNMDVNVFLSRWLTDVALEQTDEGIITHITPYTSDYRELARTQFKSDTSSGWGDAGVILPYYLYKTYGNRKVLADQYDSMRAWVDYELKRAAGNNSKHYKPKSAEDTEQHKYIWDTDFHYGDHLIPSITKKLGMFAMLGTGKTHAVAATAYMYQSTRFLAEAASILCKGEDAEYYRDKAERIKAAFAHTFFTHDGRMIPDWQSAYTLALGMDLTPEKWKESCLDRLAELLKENGGCLDCGFLSIQYLLEVFSGNGRADQAYDLLFQEKCPSWLYEVNMGATSIWESWTAVKPNGKTGSFSYNHYAFGCVGDWMYRNILGIKNAGIGYKDIVIQPLMTQRLTSAKGSYQSMYGTITSEWSIDNGMFWLKAAIPCNTTATVILPDGSRHQVGSGLHEFKCAYVS